MTTMVPSISAGAELVWVGDGGWVAFDRAVPENDPRRVIAHLEHKDHRVYVLWVRERNDVCCYETLREALQAVAACSSSSQTARRDDTRMASRRGMVDA